MYIHSNYSTLKYLFVWLMVDLCCTPVFVFLVMFLYVNLVKRGNTTTLILLDLHVIYY
eukprot:UN00734